MASSNGNLVRRVRAKAPHPWIGHLFGERLLPSAEAYIIASWPRGCMCERLEMAGLQGPSSQI